MQLKQLWQDDDAVSPVIGVILMVAITVILAAVIATFVLGLGDQVSDTAPQASFSFDWEGSATNQDDLTITHSGGDTLEAGNLFLRGNYGGNNGSIDVNWALDGPFNTNSEITAGTDIVLGDSDSPKGNAEDVGTNEIASDAEVDVIWERAEGDSSATLGSWEGPDA